MIEVFTPLCKAVFESCGRVSILQLAILEQAAHTTTGSGIARALGCSHANISGIVERMVQAGLLERELLKTDRRKRVLRLTEEGGMLYSKVKAVIAELASKLPR